MATEGILNLKVRVLANTLTNFPTYPPYPPSGPSLKVLHTVPVPRHDLETPVNECAAQNTSKGIRGELGLLSTISN